MKLVYFAWIKSKIGIAEEEIDPPETVSTVGELLTWLSERGPNYGEALSDLQISAGRDQSRIRRQQRYDQSR